MGSSPLCFACATHPVRGFDISRSGTRIYHVPGGPWYARTRIDTSKGERWFCSEAEARAAGWRRAKRCPCLSPPLDASQGDLRLRIVPASFSGIGSAVG